MGTITMSGFNNIDFNALLEAVMTQERQPVTALETKKTNLSAQVTAFTNLATKLSALETAASDLSSVTSFAGRSVTSTDPTIVSASVSSAASTGNYEVVVNAIAKAQVTVSTSTHADKDETAVATGGTLVIKGASQSEGVTVDFTGQTPTLQDIADAINNADDIAARATIVFAAGNYQLVLTGADTGAANSFTVENNLQGSTLAFTSGATNPVTATDADITVNNVRATSSSNVITDVIAGVTLNVLKLSGGTSETISVTQDTSATEDKLRSFISAYNDLVSFLENQASSTRNGTTGAIGNDPLVRSLRSNLSSIIGGSRDVGGMFGNLAEIGLEFDRTGRLSLNQTMFDSAMDGNQTDVEQLLAGTSTADGAFDAILAGIRTYTEAGGLVPDAKDRLNDQVSALSDRIDEMDARLEIRRAALAAEYRAADEQMTKLNAMLAQLNSLG